MNARPRRRETSRASHADETHLTPHIRNRGGCFGACALVAKRNTKLERGGSDVPTGRTTRSRMTRRWPDENLRRSERPLPQGQLDDYVMSAQMQSRIRGGMAAAASVALIGTGMVLMNERAHEQAQRLALGEGLSADVTASAHRLQRGLFMALDTLRDQSLDHASLTIFALAAAVLLLVMLRT